MGRWFAFIFGVVLLVCGVGTWYWLSLRPTLADAEFSLAPQVHIPISKLAEQRNLELNIIQYEIPPQIRRVWGDPDLVVVALSIDRQLQYCFDSLQVTLLSGPKLGDAGRAEPVYGYGTAYDGSCHSIGRRVRLGDGEQAYLQLTGTINDLPADVEFVLVNTWPNTKDKLGGIHIDQYVRKVANWSVSVGMLLLLFSAFLFLCAKRKSRVPVDVLP